MYSTSLKMLRHFVPFRQVIFRCGQVETDIYLLTGLEDFNYYFSSLVSKSPSAPSFLKIAVSFSHFLITKTKKKKQNKTKNDEGRARIKRQLTRPVSLIATQPSRALVPIISTNGGLLLFVTKRSLSFLGTGAVK